MALNMSMFWMIIWILNYYYYKKPKLQLQLLFIAQVLHKIKTHTHNLHTNKTNTCKGFPESKFPYFKIQTK